jgi:hypothetical protein
MLVIETCSNGKTKVVLKKDWNPSMLGKAYFPKLKNFVDSADAERIQRGLLKWRKK